MSIHEKLDHKSCSHEAAEAEKTQRGVFFVASFVGFGVKKFGK